MGQGRGQGAVAACTVDTRIYLILENLIGLMHLCGWLSTAYLTCGCLEMLS